MKMIVEHSPRSLFFRGNVGPDLTQTFIFLSIDFLTLGRLIHFLSFICFPWCTLILVALPF